MKKYCDLHTHSRFSDGTCTPEEIIDLALHQGLSAVALTDHNTVDGLPSFLEAASGKDVLPVPGVEISTSYLNKKLHIVGLFLKPEEFDTVAVFLEIDNFRKEESNRNLIQALSQAGYDLDYDTLRQQHPDGTVNRAVIAAALVEKGYVSSVEEVFQNLLHRDSGFYVPPERINAFMTIRFLSKISAVPVLAHPFLNLTEEELRQFLPEAKKYGLVAMETMYPSYSEETAALAAQMAEEYGLLPSGGSDFHGDNKPGIALGTGRGTLHIPMELAEKLQEVIRK